MDGFYTWVEHVDGERVLLRAYLKEEPLRWEAVVKDNKGNIRWTENFGSSRKAKIALLDQVPDDATFCDAEIPD